MGKEGCCAFMCSSSALLLLCTYGRDQRDQYHRAQINVLLRLYDACNGIVPAGNSSHEHSICAATGAGMTVQEQRNVALSQL